MAQGPPSSDSEPDVPDDTREYQYESEGEEMLGTSARSLLREAHGSYRRESSPQISCAKPNPAFSCVSCIIGIHKVMDHFLYSNPSA